MWGFGGNLPRVNKGLAKLAAEDYVRSIEIQKGFPRQGKGSDMRKTSSTAAGGRTRRVGSSPQNAIALWSAALSAARHRRPADGTSADEGGADGQSGLRSICRAGRPPGHARRARSRLLAKSLRLISTLILAAAFWFRAMNGSAQVPQFVWARSDGNSLAPSGNGLAVDLDGNVYVTGGLVPGKFGDVTITSLTAFIGKYDSLGRILWISTDFGVSVNSGPFVGNGLALDGAGNIYVTGVYLPAARAVFVAKFDQQGKRVWFRTSSASQDDSVRQGNGICVDGDGNVLVGGTFRNTINFGGASVGGDSYAEGFLAKYDSTGAVLWLRRMGGVSWDETKGVAVDADGNIYVTGYYTAPVADVGGIPLTAPEGHNWAFVAKYDKNGIGVWARGFGGNSHDFGTSVAIGATDNCFVGSVADWDGLGSPSLRLALTKFGRDGVMQWSRKTGSFQIRVGNLPSMSVATDALGNPVLAGTFTGSITAGGQGLSSAGGTDIVLAKYNSSGDLNWAKRAGYIFDETVNGLAIDRSGNSFLRGSFASRTQFDSIAFDGGGIFVAKLASDTSVSPVLVSLNGQFVTRSPVEVLASARVELSTTFPNGAIFYTLDGTDPTAFSRRYSQPFTLTHSAVLRAVAYSADFTKSGESPPLSIVVQPGYTLTTRTAGGGSFTVSPPSGPYPSNAVVQITAVPAPGWKFLGWLGDASGASATVSVTLNRNRSIEGVFGTALTTSVNGSGSVVRDPPGDTYPYGAVVQLTGVPGSGGSFAAWGDDVVIVANPLRFTITSPAPNVSALFLPLSVDQFALTVEPRGHGTVRVSPRANRFPAGQRLTVTAVPDDGEQFLGWSGDASGTQDQLVLTLDASKTITAEFTRKPQLSIEPAFDLAGREALRVFVGGEMDERYTIERSADLRAWTQRGETANQFGTAQFFETMEAGAQRLFYRAVVKP